MPEPLKNLFNENVIRSMAGHLVRVAPDFDEDAFVSFALNGLDALELKQRSSRLCEGLERFLPADFEAATSILVASLEPGTDLTIGEMEQGASTNGIRGWAVMPMADYIARNGQDHLALSMDALREMTMRSSSEFAIRHFIINHKESVLKTLMLWTGDDNYHVRRLVSEGTRPRLPWAMRLPQFIKDPMPVLALLEQLKDDGEEYVRRSVANNLNDISKDHPDLVAETAERWMKNAPAARVKLIRHALRTLIKSGHSGALNALGYSFPKVELRRFQVLTKDVNLGGTLEFELEIASTSARRQPLIIDYAVHHMRANGKTTPKVFKWRNITLEPGENIAIKKRHAIREITTRQYYSGAHRVEIMVNGKSLGEDGFSLIVG